MNSTNPITRRDRGGTWLLLLMATFLMSWLPKGAAAKLDLSRVMTISGGITAVDVSTGSYQWAESDKEGFTPGLISTNPGGDDTRCTLSMQITCESEFQLSFDYKYRASDNRYLIVTVDGSDVLYEMVNGEKHFSLPIVAGRHEVDITYRRSDGGSADENALSLYNMKLSTTIDKPTEKRAMAVYDKTDNSFTFYYDTEVRPCGDLIPMEVLQITDNVTGQYWNKANWTYDVKTVVFDKSFKDFKPVRIYYWFWYFVELAEVRGIENLNTSEATDIVGLFCNCYKLKSMDLSRMDAKKAGALGDMFFDCKSLESLNLTGFTTDACFSMDDMFNGCAKLKELDLSSFNTANVYVMSSMFEGCESLQTIYVSDKFKTGNVAHSDKMFSGCTSLTGAMAYDANCTNATYANYETGYFTKGCLHQDEAGNSTWDTPVETEATCIEGAYTTYTCSLCQRTKKVYTSDPVPTAHRVVRYGAVEPTCGQDGNREYYRCEICHKVWLDSGLTEKASDERAYTIRRTGHILDQNGYCSECQKQVLTLHGVTAKFVNIADTSWDILDSDDGKHGLADACEKNTPLAMILTSDKDFELNFRFEVGNGSFSIVLDGKAYDTYDIEPPYYLKAGSHKLLLRMYGTPGDSDCRLYNITATTELKTKPAESCGKFVYDKQSGIATLYSNDKAPKAAANLQVLDLPELYDFTGRMWFDDFAFVSRVVVDESFKQARPKSTAFWFYQFVNCMDFVGLENLDLSETTSTNKMFGECMSVKTLDITTFNTAKVTDMTGMFSYCESLTTIYVGDGFSTANVEGTPQMFNGCTSLKGAIGYDKDKVSVEYANCETAISPRGVCTRMHRAIQLS